MTVKLLILGHPGSGKSAAARYISTLAQNYGWLSTRINDYEILQEKFRSEKLSQFATKLRRFRSTEHGGFDVVDFSVLDETLIEVERRVRKLTLPLGRERFIIIEFARHDYHEALQQISHDLLQDAYFLFINSDMDSCKQRIYKRITHRATPDDHFVSTEIIERYYHKENKQFMISSFAEEHGIPYEKVQVIDNTGTLKDFHRKIYEFAEAILEQETYSLRDTDPIQKIPPSVSEATHSSLAMEIQASERDNM